MFFGSSQTTSSSSSKGMRSSAATSTVMTPTRLSLDGTTSPEVVDDCQPESNPDDLILMAPQEEFDSLRDSTNTTQSSTANDMSPQQTQPLRRINSSLIASSEVVHALFGQSVGPCWGDFYCSHMRIRGRLYATSAAVLFYTNLLGFERRICLLLRDVVHMELFRTTSIRIQTSDLETYIFKSFNDREQVLHLLNGLKILSDKQAAQQRQQNNRKRNASSDLETQRTANRAGLDNGAAPAGNYPADNISGAATPPSPSLNNVERSAFSRTTATVSGGPGLPSLLPTTPPLSPSTVSAASMIPPARRRAASDSIIRIPNDDGNGSQPVTSSLVRCRLEPIGSSEELSFSATPDDPTTVVETPPSASPRTGDGGRLSPPDAGDPPEQEWSMILATKTQLQEVGLESLQLDCSMEDYYKTFLADTAPYPLDYYQKEHIKDKNVELTGWDIGAEGDFKRTITFTHPIKNSMGFGPTSAETSRHQRLRKFDAIGCLALENRTHVEGLPAADCFYVKDLWVLQAIPDNPSQVQLSVQFDVIFKKRSLFRNIIQKSVRKETKEWIAGYVDMVQGVLQRQDGESPGGGGSQAKAPSTGGGPQSLGMDAQTVQIKSLVRLAGKLEQAYQLIFMLTVVLLVAVFLFSYQMMTMNQCLLDLRQDLLLQQIAAVEAAKPVVSSVI